MAYQHIELRFMQLDFAAFFSILTLKSVKPADVKAGASSVVSSFSTVIFSPVAYPRRQAGIGRFVPGKTASLDSFRISTFVSPHSRRGERTLSSLRASHSRRSASSSEAFVPSNITSNPSDACFRNRFKYHILAVIASVHGVGLHIAVGQNVKVYDFYLGLQLFYSLSASSSSNCG